MDVAYRTIEEKFRLIRRSNPFPANPRLLMLKDSYNMLRKDKKSYIQISITRNNLQFFLHYYLVSMV